MGVITPGEAFNPASHANRVSASLQGEIRVGGGTDSQNNSTKVYSSSLNFFLNYAHTIDFIYIYFCSTFEKTKTN